MESRHQTTKNSNFWTSAGASPSSGAHLGAGIFTIWSLLHTRSFIYSPKSPRPSISTLALAHTRATAFIFALVFALALFGFSIFSQNAYAASYINVSSGSGGTVSLGSIKPSSTGVSASGSDTLTITTNCSAGYSVYVSGQEGGDTNLTNTDKTITSGNIISASSIAVGSTATTLNSNTWGITGDSNNASASKYVGLPSYANATNKALISNSSADTSGDNKSTVYYGVKVDTTLAPGTYSGDVLYTTLIDNTCNVYTIVYNANASSGITGTMEDQTIDVGSPTALTKNAFERAGYTFLGWSASEKGKTGTVVNGIGTEADVDYADEEEVTNLALAGDEVMLYAIWEDATTMQDWAADNGCTSLAAGSTITLKDARDNSRYGVKKFNDGSCWMTENLVLGYDKGYALTSELTNISANDDGTLSDSGTYYLPQAGYRGNFNSATPTGTPVFSNNDSNGQAKVQYAAKDSTDSVSSSSAVPQSTGYYNFYAATLGCSYYNDGNSTCRSGYVQKDICPKGWQLPAGGSNTTKSWVSLDNTLNPDATNVGTARNDLTSTNNFLSKAGFAYSGYYDGTSLYFVGREIRLWSSTVQDTNFGFSISLQNGTLDSQTIMPQLGSRKYSGLAVRCVAQDSYTINYSSSGSTSGNPSKTTEGTIFENFRLANRC